MINYSTHCRILELIRLLQAQAQKNLPHAAAILQKEIRRTEGSVFGHRKTENSWGATQSEYGYRYYLRQMESALSSGNVANELQFITYSAKENAFPKPRICFFVQEYACWPSFDTIWKNFSEEYNCECDIVFAYDPGTYRAYEATKEQEAIAYKNEKFEEFSKQCYSICRLEEYDFCERCPDIVLYEKPYLGYHGLPRKAYVNEIERHTPYTAFISYCIDVQAGDDLRRLLFGLPAFYHYWRIVGYSQYYMEMTRRYGFRNGENAVFIGHPKFDNSHAVNTSDEFLNPEWAKKAAGRKVILWNTHFTVKDNQNVGTFFQWKDTIIPYFQKNRDVVLLWRPHPLFWQSVLESGKITEREFNDLVAKLEAQDNVIIDRTGDYRHAFRLADALITDATTFLVEFNATGKPLIYTPKHGGEGVCNPAAIENMYIANTEADMLSFLENIRTGKDPMAAARKQSFEAEFGKSDGKIGSRIAQYLLSEMEADITARVAALFSGANS